MLAEHDWRPAARCRNRKPDELFVTGARQREAREMCRPCPVRTECLAHALDHRIEFGVWGGLTERERRGLVQRPPAGGSWSDLLLAARREYDRGRASLDG